MSSNLILIMLLKLWIWQLLPPNVILAIKFWLHYYSTRKSAVSSSNISMKGTRLSGWKLPYPLSSLRHQWWYLKEKGKKKLLWFCDELQKFWKNVQFVFFLRNSFKQLAYLTFSYNRGQFHAFTRGPDNNQ